MLINPESSIGQHCHPASHLFSRLTASQPRPGQGCRPFVAKLRFRDASRTCDTVSCPCVSQGACVSAPAWRRGSRSVPQASEAVGPFPLNRLRWGPAAGSLLKVPLQEASWWPVSRPFWVSCRRRWEAASLVGVSELVVRPRSELVGHTSHQKHHAHGHSFIEGTFAVGCLCPPGTGVLERELNSQSPVSLGV